ncbi:RNA-guided endonuclease IscB [Microscilla marina]|uniref:Paclitaxel/taxanoid biosynthesis susceptibility protein TS1 n=1 Tax=Microscilla marina ATCC 23134 TaxID=313606 RepID=A1ZG09_MICM2|nr:RNA-guided endonuclease IscB [Microscilla marina]EAY30426.1 paclitaxel/taxanoid biosynthesis susceptibility protein TS1 [Microscilla marina ATCC 23134]
MVYVKSKNGKALMPTANAKARKLLRYKKAFVVKYAPFTIQLKYDSTEYVQQCTLGVDLGYANVGFSVVTDSKELISGELKLLRGQKDRLLEKSQYRRIRRQRLRYRKPRFDNRKSSKPILAPSIQHKLDSQIRLVEQVQDCLPVSGVVLEVANFDIQKIKNPDIEGKQYQKGEQEGFWNIREYVLHRDKHSCQNPDCKNKYKGKILQVHHIVFKSMGGGDTPNNLITLCTKCHTSANHKKGGFLWDWCKNGKKVSTSIGATFMSTVKWMIYQKCKDITNTSITFGYITKSGRVKNNIEKSHANDAFIIAGGTSRHKRSVYTYNIEQNRLSNRSLSKFYDKKVVDIRTGGIVKGAMLDCGRRTRNKSLNGENLRVFRDATVSKGRVAIRKGKSAYQPNDKVIFEGEKFTVKGTHNKNSRVILKEINKSVALKKVTPFSFKKSTTWNVQPKITAS